MFDGHIRCSVVVRVESTTYPKMEQMLPRRHRKRFHSHVDRAGRCVHALHGKRLVAQVESTAAVPLETSRSCEKSSYEVRGTRPWTCTSGDIHILVRTFDCPKVVLLFYYMCLYPMFTHSIHLSFPLSRYEGGMMKVLSLAGVDVDDEDIENIAARYTNLMFLEAGQPTQRSRGRITRLPDSLGRLTDLIFIVMNHHAIKRVDFPSLPDLKVLRHIELSGNLVTELPTRLPLSVLWCAFNNNKLTALPVAFFRRHSTLSALELEGVCMQWIERDTDR